MLALDVEEEVLVLEFLVPGPFDQVQSNLTSCLWTLYLRCERETVRTLSVNG